VFAIGVENHEIGITARGNCAFPRIEAEKLCRSGGHELHKAIHAESILGNATE